jgi:hypothetical protein
LLQDLPLNLADTSPYSYSSGSSGSSVGSISISKLNLMLLPFLAEVQTLLTVFEISGSIKS